VIVKNVPINRAVVVALPDEIIFSVGVESREQF
jgi:hypothetical protein